VLRDVGRFLSFDGSDAPDGILVELYPTISWRIVSSAIEILRDETQAARQHLEFVLMSAPDPKRLKAAQRLALPVILQCGARTSRRFFTRPGGLAECGLLREVALRLTPALAESLDAALSLLAGAGAPAVSLQMEYARAWSLYDYHLIAQTVQRLRANAWRIGAMVVRLGDPMCRAARSGDYCGAGVTKVAIGPEGVLYPCHRFIGDRARAIGTAALGFWPGVLRFHRYRPDQNPDCEGCPLIPHCDGGCIRHNLRETGRMDRTTSAVCEFTKALFCSGGGGVP
jgi:radical SAM protein with 4Fe4S-binding SPASM domain